MGVVFDDDRPLPDGLTLAAENGPGLRVVAGLGVDLHDGPGAAGALGVRGGHDVGEAALPDRREPLDHLRDIGGDDFERRRCGAKVVEERVRFSEARVGWKGHADLNRDFGLDADAGT